MNKDTVAGAIKETGGEIRESIANVTGDDKAKALAQKDEVEGNVQKNYGKVKDALDA